VEKVDEYCFLFGIQGGANAHSLAVRAAGVKGDFLDPLGGLEGAGGPFGVRCLLGAHL
jgi:hypothetical protein